MIGIFIELSNLSFAYDSSKVILKDINLQVDAGEFVCLLGHSGCGKSTMLRLLAGLESPTAGTVSIDGKPVERAGLNRGVVFQDYGLFPWMTAGENITLALEQRFPRMKRAERKTRAIEMLRRVGLDADAYGRLPKELSGGMQQRCAIAQTLAVDPPLLLMDEPFGALDAITRAKLQDMVRDLWAESAGENVKTAFFVTHDVDEALLLGTRIIVLGQSPSSVIHDHAMVEPRPTRNTMFNDVGFMELRNTLISQISSNVIEKLE